MSGSNCFEIFIENLLERIYFLWKVDLLIQFDLNDMIRVDDDCLTCIFIALRFLSPFEVLLWVFPTHLYYFKFWSFSQIFVEIYLRFKLFSSLFFSSFCQHLTYWIMLERDVLRIMFEAHCSFLLCFSYIQKYLVLLSYLPWLFLTCSFV